MPSAGTITVDGLVPWRERRRLALTLVEPDIEDIVRRIYRGETAPASPRAPPCAPPEGKDPLPPFRDRYGRAGGTSERTASAHRSMDGRSARNALPRWEAASLAAGSASALVSVQPSGTNTGS